MSQLDRIEALKEKHAMLERAIDEESHRPLPDQAAVHDLKTPKTPAHVTKSASSNENSNNSIKTIN